MKKVGTTYNRDGINYLVVDNNLIRKFKHKDHDAYYNHNNTIYSLGMSNNTVDVSNVTNMSSVFHNAHKFNDDISSWDISNFTSVEYIFDGKTISDINNHNIPKWYTDRHQKNLTIAKQKEILEIYKI